MLDWRTDVVIRGVYGALFLRLAESHSRPSKRPSPEVAQVDWMYQVRARKLVRPSLSVISAAAMAFCKVWSAHRAPSYTRGCLAYGKILLVGENEKEGVPQLVLVEHTLKLLTGLGNTVTIVAVDDEDDTLGILEIMPPQGADLVLTSDVPDSELNVLVLDGLDVEAWRGTRSQYGLSFPGADCGGEKVPRIGRHVPMVGMVVTTSPSLSL